MLVGPPGNSGSADGHRSHASKTLEKTPDEGGQSPLGRSFAILAGWMTIIAGLLALFNGFRALLGETSSDSFEIVIDLNRYSM